MECKRTSARHARVNGKLRALAGAALLGAAVPMVSAIALLAAMPALAQNETSNFAIPAQPLADALFLYRAQSGVSVAFLSDDVRDKRAPSVSGTLSNCDALARLLAGSGLKMDFVGPRTARISAQREKQTAVVPALAPVSASARPLRAPAPFDAPDELVVVASRLANGEGAAPVVSMTRTQIDATGAETITQALNNLPQVGIKQTTSPASNGRGNSTVSLRGLPGGMSLTMLDGRKLASSAYQTTGNVTNLNLLPLAVIDRIDVLPNGSSAVYGGDGLAGVINIVLRKKFDGVAADIRYGDADGLQERQIRGAWGTSWDRGSIAVTAEYDSNGALGKSRRALTATSDFRAYGGSLSTTQYTMPGNIYSLNGQNIPGLTSTVAGIPAGTNGIGLAAANFAPTAGRPNTATTFTSEGVIIPRIRQYGGLLYGTLDLSDTVELYANLLHTHREAEERDYEQLAPGQTGTVVIPASNPFNPFGVPLGLNYLFRGAGAACYCLTQDYTRGVAGARGELRGWKWDVGATHTRSRDLSDEDGVYSDYTKINAALADTNPATAFNPFADRSWTKAQVEPFNTHVRQISVNELTTVDASLRGTAFELPTGPVQLSLGVEYDHNKLNYVYAPLSVRADRDVGSAFGEARIPLLGPAEPGGQERIVLSGALRYDRYSDAGGSASKQAGLEVRPVEGLLLRGSWATAFKPPSLYQLYSPVQSFTFATLVDRRRGETYPVNYIQGGNPGLQSLTGESRTLGFVLNPKILHGLEISASKWSIKIDNYASTFGLQTMADNEDLFSAYVTRAAPTAADTAAGRPGRITFLRNVTANYGSMDLAGADFSVRWPFSTEIGTFTPGVIATNTYRYNVAIIPGAGAAQRAGKANTAGYAPKWKLQTSLAWSTDYVDALMVGNYVGSYRDYAPSQRSLGKYWTVDANARIAIGHLFRPGDARLEQTYLTVGARNLFDNLPVYSAFSPSGSVGFDPTQYDIIGRYLYVQLGVRF